MSLHRIKMLHSFPTSIPSSAVSPLSWSFEGRSFVENTPLVACIDAIRASVSPIAFIASRLCKARPKVAPILSGTWILNWKHGYWIAAKLTRRLALTLASFDERTFLRSESSLSSTMPAIRLCPWTAGTSLENLPCASHTMTSALLDRTWVHALQLTTWTS